MHLSTCLVTHRKVAKVLSLFDIAVDEVFEKPKPKVVTPKRKPMVIKTDTEAHRGTPPTQKELMDRLVLLKDKLSPYKDMTLEQVAKFSISEKETVRTFRIQVEQLQKALGGHNAE